MRVYGIVTAVMMGLALTGCATHNEEDPMESLNRGVFQFNEVVDNIVLKPVAHGYRFVTTPYIRDRVSGVAQNLGEPITVANALLQGDVDRSFIAFWRFMLNSTVGIGGMFDVAATAGLNYRSEDFGQTLGAWGAGSGPYVVLPILGPSNGRDVVGLVVDWFTDPFRYTLEDNTDAFFYASAKGIEKRERLLDPIDDIYESSLDPYVSLRSIYTQQRDAEIKNSYDYSDKGQF
ncbi:MAG: VacJ family lipoprotein [Alphaproteobacteria bacterium]|nr:VacJ family lipoprotein [Alphaproteobacteria bacterium]